MAGPIYARETTKRSLEPDLIAVKGWGTRRFSASPSGGEPTQPRAGLVGHPAGLDYCRDATLIRAICE
jgi:hypothetical protein